MTAEDQNYPHAGPSGKGGFDPKTFKIPKIIQRARTGVDQLLPTDVPQAAEPPLGKAIDTGQPPIKSGERGVSTPTPLSPLSKPAPADDVSKSSILAAHEDLANDVYFPAPKSNPVVEALIAANLYVRTVGDGRHECICPWSSEHAPGETAPSTYDEPTTTHSVGHYRCLHTHAEPRNASDLIDHLGLSPAVARAKPRIRIVPGDGHLAVHAAEKILSADGTYFHAAGRIVRVRQRGGDVTSEPVNEQTLTAALSAKIDWERKGQGNEWVRSNPDSQVIQSLSRGQDHCHLRQLNAIAHQPFYRPDGTLVTSPGFDAETGIYAAFDPEDYRLPEPTRENAEMALAYFRWLLREYLFASSTALYAAITAILTGVIRPSLPLAPAFNITAPRSGSGKSHLAELVMLAAGPGRPHRVSYPTNETEATKLMLAIFLAKPAVVFFDDMQTDWKSFGPINSALTSGTISGRVLGLSQIATASTTALFLGTGNGIEPLKDMRRRVVSIPLADAPVLRVYSKDPVAIVKNDRAEFVRYALTIIEAYRQGSELVDMPPIGSYGEWSKYCRDPLIWLSGIDPASSLIEQVTQDEDQDLLGEFLTIWRRIFGSRPVMVRDFVREMATTADLADLLEEMGLMNGRNLNAHKLGQFFKRNRGRRADGYYIERAPDRERRFWKVVAYD